MFLNTPQQRRSTYYFSLKLINSYRMSRLSHMAWKIFAKSQIRQRHEHDSMSFFMLQICGKSIWESRKRRLCFWVEKSKSYTRLQKTWQTTVKKLPINITIALFWKVFRKITLYVNVFIFHGKHSNLTKSIRYQSRLFMH